MPSRLLLCRDLFLLLAGITHILCLTEAQNEADDEGEEEQQDTAANTLSERLDKVLPILARSEIATRLENEFFGKTVYDR